MSAIGKMIDASSQSVMRWIIMFYDKFILENDITSETEEIDIDKMYSYINKKTSNPDLESY